MCERLLKENSWQWHDITLMLSGDILERKGREYTPSRFVNNKYLYSAAQLVSYLALAMVHLRAAFISCVIPRSWAICARRFERAWWSHPQGFNVQYRMRPFRPSRMRSARYLETSGTDHPVARYHIAEDRRLRCETFFATVDIQDGARNVIPLIVHITHFYCYKSVWHLVQN